MKSLLFVSLGILIFVSLFKYSGFAQESGAVHFLGHIIPPQGDSYISGCWGWTDTTTGREYALLGSVCGTSIVEITNTDSLREVDFIPGVCSHWRELQTYSHYAYVVSEGGGGVQIIDLSYLPDSAHLVKDFIYYSPGDNSKNTRRSHSNHIYDGYLYLNGCANWQNGGILIFDLSDPENPQYNGSYQYHYTHDCFVKGNVLYGAAIDDGGFDILNVSQKTNPMYVKTVYYPGAGTHNLATTEDGKYLLTTDEVGTTKKTLKIWDITNINTIHKVAEYEGDPTAIVHNVFVKGNLAFMSYYTAGLRVVDITNPENPIEIGGYDTYPGESGSYDGAWSTYPFFPSGKVIIGDRSTALYVVELNWNKPQVPTLFTAYSDYRTPNSILLRWNDPSTYYNGSPLPDFHIRIYRDGLFIADIDQGQEQYVDSGLIQHQSYNYFARTILENDSSLTPNTVSAYCGGHAELNPPTEFLITRFDGGMKLVWRNPSRQKDNTPLNDLASIDIYRNNVLYDSILVSVVDTGLLMQYNDSSIGYHYYSVSARDNEYPIHQNGTTTLFGYGGPLVTTFNENFESKNDFIYVQEGPWDTTHLTSSSGIASFTDSPAGLPAHFSHSAFILPPIKISSNYILKFDEICLMNDTFQYTFIGALLSETNSYSLGKTSNTDHKEWQDNSLDSNDWFTKIIPLSDPGIQNREIRIIFGINSFHMKLRDGWYIDNIYVGPDLTDVHNSSNNIPPTLMLCQNYPNPFNPITNIGFTIVNFGYVSLTIYNAVGQIIETIVQETMPPGTFTKVWNAEQYPSGIYYYQLKAGQKSVVKPMILIR